MNKDVLVCISLKLNYEDLINFSQVFKEIDEICSDNIFWMQKIKYDFDLTVNKENFKEYYLEIQSGVEKYMFP
jgi:hypothetical protein